MGIDVEMPSAQAQSETSGQPAQQLQSALQSALDGAPGAPRAPGAVAVPVAAAVVVPAAAPRYASSCMPAQPPVVPARPAPISSDEVSACAKLVEEAKFAMNREKVLESIAHYTQARGSGA